jgi:quinol monooxygenase YgiN
MPQDTLHVIARLKAKPEKAAELHELLFGLLAPTRKENGCIVYRMLVNEGDPADFTFVEEWTGAPALEAHFETPHLKNALARFPDLLAAELDVRRYRLVG